MGLDWCVMDRIKDGNDSEFERLNGVLSSLIRDRDNLWAKFASDDSRSGLSGSPGVAEEFSKSSNAIALGCRIDMVTSHISTLTVSPMVTMGAPIAGTDPAANEYLRKDYETHREWFGESYATVDDYLAHKKGKYVPEAIDSDGIGVVSGMCVGSESFRGKMLNFVDWLPSTGFDVDYYADKTPDELIDLGNSLIDALSEYNSFRDSRMERVANSMLVDALEDWYKTAKVDCNGDPVDPEPDDDELRESISSDVINKVRSEIGSYDQDGVEIVSSAAKWCLFWGSNGHGMHAWY